MRCCGGGSGDNCSPQPFSRHTCNSASFLSVIPAVWGSPTHQQGRNAARRMSSPKLLRLGLSPLGKGECSAQVDRPAIQRPLDTAAAPASAAAAATATALHTAPPNPHWQVTRAGSCRRATHMASRWPAARGLGTSRCSPRRLASACPSSPPRHAAVCFSPRSPPHRGPTLPLLPWLPPQAFFRPPRHLLRRLSGRVAAVAEPATAPAAPAGQAGAAPTRLQHAVSIAPLPGGREGQRDSLDTVLLDANRQQTGSCSRQRQRVPCSRSRAASPCGAAAGRCPLQDALEAVLGELPLLQGAAAQPDAALLCPQYEVERLEGGWQCVFPALRRACCAQAGGSMRMSAWLTPSPCCPRRHPHGMQAGCQSARRSWRRPSGRRGRRRQPLRTCGLLRWSARCAGGARGGLAMLAKARAAVRTPCLGGQQW